METSEIMTFGDCLNDTIHHFEVGSVSMDDSVMVLKTVPAMVSSTMDCDHHPTCDCYSQCHAIIW